MHAAYSSVSAGICAITQSMYTRQNGQKVAKEIMFRLAPYSLLVENRTVTSKSIQSILMFLYLFYFPLCGQCRE